MKKKNDEKMLNDLLSCVFRVQQEEKDKEEEQMRAGLSKKDLNKEKGRDRSRSKSPMSSRSPRESVVNLGLSPMKPVTPRKSQELTLSSSNLRSRSPMDAIGRRLSHGGNGGSPPLERESNFGGTATLRVEDVPLPVRTGRLTPKQMRSPNMRGHSFPVFTLSKPRSSMHYGLPSPLLSPNADPTIVGCKLSKEWGSGVDVSRSAETFGELKVTTLGPEPHLRDTQPSTSRKKKSLGGMFPFKQGMTRAKSHESREGEKSLADQDVTSPRLAEPIIGGRSTTDNRTRRQLDSELRAILTARAHHLDLEPP